MTLLILRHVPVGRCLFLRPYLSEADGDGLAMVSLVLCDPPAEVDVREEYATLGTDSVDLEKGICTV